MARRVSDSESEEIGLAGPAALLAAQRRPPSRKRSRPAPDDEVEEIDSDSGSGGDSADFSGLARRRRPRQPARGAADTQSASTAAVPPARDAPRAPRALAPSNGQGEQARAAASGQFLWIDQFAPERREDLALHRTAVSKVRAGRTAGRRPTGRVP